jgi:hypothetical protein
VQECVSVITGASLSILTGRHALCLRVQSSKAWNVCQKWNDCSLDAGATNGFGQKIGNVLVTGDKADLKEFLSDKVSDEVESKIHVFCTETILTNLAQGQIDCTPVVNVYSGDGRRGTDDDLGRRGSESIQRLCMHQQVICTLPQWRTERLLPAWSISRK